MSGSAATKNLEVFLCVTMASVATTAGGSSSCSFCCATAAAISAATTTTAAAVTTTAAAADTVSAQYKKGAPIGAPDLFAFIS